MTGAIPGGILAIVGSFWWLAVNWQLYRDPDRLHPKHWRYQAIYRRVRGGVHCQRDDQLSSDEIKSYALGSMFVGVLGIGVGVLMIVGLLA
jgi:hypothetical protein